MDFLFSFFFFFFFQAEDGIRDYKVTGVQTCALPIWFRFSRSAKNVTSATADNPARHPRRIPNRDLTASQYPIQLSALAPAFCPATGPATSSVFTFVPAADWQQHSPYIMLFGGRFGATSLPVTPDDTPYEHTPSAPSPPL